MRTPSIILATLTSSGESKSPSSRARRLLEEAIAARAFPGAAVAVWHRGRAFEIYAGRFTYETSPQVDAHTIYDIASLTKVVAVTAMAMALFERGKLTLEQPVAKLLPQFASGGDPRRREVTIRQLLSHSSGLPAHLKLYEQTQGKQVITALACAAGLKATPGERMAYSDIGFIVLGALLEKAAGVTLDAFCKREIFAPLKMTDTMFLPPKTLQPRIPPTVEDKIFRKRVVCGEVHDENSSAMGGVAAHAGVFSTASDIRAFSACLLNGGAPVFKPATISLFTRREDSPEGTTRALGWDTPSAASQAGRYFSNHSFGHLGYTGTSLWIDPERELAIVMLSNRTWPDDRSQLIKQVRPAVHDVIIEGLGIA